MREPTAMERVVAEAIHNNYRAPVVGVLIDGESILDDGEITIAWSECLRLARAAIRAMTTYTPSMIAAAMRPYDGDSALVPSHGIDSAGQLPAWHVIDTAYHAMIDAASPPEAA